MPILTADYVPPLPWFKNPHIATIYPTQFRKITLPRPLVRTRLTTADDDFLDLDLSSHQHHRAAVILHGFEGSSQSSYVRGASRYLMNHHWDIAAINYRGCSGEPNRTSRAYHAGEYEDVALVIDELIRLRDYKEIALIGYSLGGNILLNYLALKSEIPTQVTAGVAISTTIDLQAAVNQLLSPENAIYQRHFYRKIIRKMKEKQKKFPDLLPYADIYRARNIDEIDEIYTAPFHGFGNAADYRKKASGMYVLEQLQRPVLLLNAQDDPFLTPSNFPNTIASTSSALSLLTPRYGGHCGFWLRGGVYYHEIRTQRFLDEHSDYTWYA